MFEEQIQEFSLVEWNFQKEKGGKKIIIIKLRKQK
jgi:hypothetical protein